MELPIVKEARRLDEDNPKVFLWERKGEHDTGIYRPRLCFTLPRKNEGAVALLFEEAEFRKQKQFYVPLFEKFSDAGELLDRVSELRKAWEIENIYSRLTRVEMEFLQFFNRKEKHRHHISVTAPPHANDQGKMGYHLGVMRELMRPGRERVFLHESIPTLLSAIPEMDPDINDMDYPAIAAAVYGVCSVYVFETIEVEKKKKPWDPWAVLRDDNKYNPIGPDDKWMKHDPLKGM